MSRCEKCKYALVNGVCPMCDGRKVAERLPMLAPLPKAANTEPKRRFALHRKGAA